MEGAYEFGNHAVQARQPEVEKEKDMIPIKSKLRSVLVVILLCASAMRTTSSQERPNGTNLNGFTVEARENHPTAEDRPNENFLPATFENRIKAPPSSAQATVCSEWQMNGEWVFVQTNNSSPVFRLRQTKTGLQGSATSYRPYRGYKLLVTGSVDGAINGDSLQITAYWDNGTIGVYTGKIGPQGRIQGSTYDRNDPENRADWYSDQTATCASQPVCPQWDMSGYWTFVQSNDTSPTFTLQQTRTGLQGKAIYWYWKKGECLIGFCGDDYLHVDASVNGALSGNTIAITAYWSNGTIGLYTGKIGPEGRLEGTTYEKERPNDLVNWYSDHTSKCLAAGAATGGLGTTSSPLQTEPALPPQFIGTFGTTPPNYQPVWVYGIQNNGDLVWYRKDAGTSPWQGPKRIGNGWDFKDVIPAGGNSFYALTDDGKLFWYQHTGFNDGTRAWKDRVQVGRGWSFTSIFSGGEGIIYAITNEGKLLWYKHNGYLTGAGLDTPGAWENPKEIGRGWNGFEQVFSSGGGIIYAITTDGKLRWYKHNGYLTGAGMATPGAWDGPKEVGRGWNGFRQIVPAGGGIILAIQNDGKLRWYKHNGYLSGAGMDTPGAWDGPTEVGTGWQGFKKVFALLPVSSAPVVR